MATRESRVYAAVLQRCSLHRGFSSVEGLHETLTGLDRLVPEGRGHPSQG